MSVDREQPASVPEHLIGRLSRIDGPDLELTSGLARLSFEFDALDVSAASPLEAVDLDAMGDLVRGVNALRISATMSRYLQFTGAVPLVGDWYSFTLTRERPKSGLAIIRSPLSVGGFEDFERLWTTSAERLFNDGTASEKTPRLGRTASVSLYTQAQTLAVTSGFPGGAVAKLQDVSSLFDVARRAHKVTVRDVGQAAYACVRDDDNHVLLYYDVGWPMPFNKKTAPDLKSFIPDPERAPISLSHWDWDHLQGAFRFKHFLECTWIAPVQQLGPGAARLAMGLHKKGRLMGLLGGVVTLPFGALGCCSGPPTNTNDSGLALYVDLPKGFRVLLVGDAAYHHLPPSWQAPVDGLVATHHGALFAGGPTSIPRPKPGRRRFIASYGAGNTYKHPHPVAVHEHKVAGWTTLDPTAGRGGGSPRGDRHFPR